MSEHHHQEHFLDRYWPVLLIAFGVACVAFLVSYYPTY